MSYLKDISESHHAVKLISVCLFLAPFWYVSIYLFNNEFYNAADVVAIIVFCCTISVISSMAFLLAIDYAFNDENPADDLSDIIMTVVILISWLSLLIFIVYSFGFLFDMYIYFYYFIILYLSPLPILFLIGLLRPKAKKL